LPIKVKAIVVTAEAVWASLGLGVIAAMIAAFVPARRAASIDPVDAMSGTIQTADVVTPPSTSLRLAFLVFLVTASLAFAARSYQHVTLAIVVAMSLLLGGTLLAPALAAVLAHFAQRFARNFGPAVLLGAVSFARNRGRNVVSTAALGLALANVV